MLKSEYSKEVNNKNWTSFKKLWLSFKIERKNNNRTKMVEIARKLQDIAPTLRDGKGQKITTPVFTFLVNEKK